MNDEKVLVELFKIFNIFWNVKVGSLNSDNKLIIYIWQLGKLFFINFVDKFTKYAHG